MNLVMATAASVKVVYFELQETKLTKFRLQHFLDNLEVVLQAMDSNNQETMLLMDNAPVHGGATYLHRSTRSARCAASSQHFFYLSDSILRKQETITGLIVTKRYFSCNELHASVLNQS